MTKISSKSLSDNHSSKTSINWASALRPSPMSTILDPRQMEIYQRLTELLAANGKPDPVAADYLAVIGDELVGKPDNIEKIRLEKIRDTVKRFQDKIEA